MSTTSTEHPNDTSPSDTHGKTPDAAAVSEALIEHQLDQLMPKPSSRFRRWLIATSVLAAVIIVGVLWSTGRIAPNPFANGSWGSHRPFIANAERTSIETQVTVPNFSDRAVRMTDIDLEGAGLELTSVAVRRQPSYEYVDGGCEVSVSNDGGSTTEACQIRMEDDQPVRTPVLPLPITLEPDDLIDVILTFAVTDCRADLDENWGTINATFDFGDGAFPPFALTHELDDRLVEDGAQVNVLLNGEAGDNGRFDIDVRGPAGLRSLLCEVAN